MQTTQVRRRGAAAGVILAVVAIGAGSARAEFTNRYAKLRGYNHQIYVEGYELPVLNAGPAEPAVSPDGRAVAVAAGGHLWRLALLPGGTVGPAQQLTWGPALDSRPAWSADGSKLAAVRDTGTDTHIVQVDVAAALTSNPATAGHAPKASPRAPAAESILVDTKAIELDPAFSADGRWLYYSSGAAGDLDLWRLELPSGKREQLTHELGLELRPLPLPDGR